MFLLLGWIQSYDRELQCQSCKILQNNEKPGANPTIVSYSDSAVKIFNATSSLVRF
jgi:hypothetical protein